MADAASWVTEAVGRAGQVLVEVLSSESVLVLSIETPGWSLTFRLPDNGVATAAAFLRVHAGRAEFAECVAGSLFGFPVWLLNDDEFDDRLWLRVYGDGQLADFPLVGETAGWFAAAIAEVAEDMEPDADQALQQTTGHDSFLGLHRSPVPRRC
jgi:hypothetical protein